MKQVKLSDQTHKQLRQLQEITGYRWMPLQRIVEVLVNKEVEKKKVN